MFDASCVFPQLALDLVREKSRQVPAGHDVVVVVDEITVVVVARVVGAVVVVGTVVVAAMDVVVVTGVTSFTTNWPGSETAPGPGRSADASTSPLPVAATQNADTRVAVAGTSWVMGPASTPCSV